jgi:hypothetical protein
MTYIPEALPADAVAVLAGRCEGRSISEILTAAYWLCGRDNATALYLLAQAHDQFAQMADAMGYTIARKPDHTAAIAALAEIDRIKAEIAALEVAA